MCGSEGRVQAPNQADGRLEGIEHLVFFCLKVPEMQVTSAMHRALDMGGSLTWI